MKLGFLALEFEGRIIEGWQCSQSIWVWYLRMVSVWIMLNWSIKELFECFVHLLVVLRGHYSEIRFPLSGKLVMLSLASRSVKRHP